MPTSQTQHWNTLHSMLSSISEGSSCSLMPEANAWARGHCLSVWATNNRTVLGRQLAAVCVAAHGTLDRKLHHGGRFNGASA